MVNEWLMNGKMNGIMNWFLNWLMNWLCIYSTCSNGMLMIYEWLMKWYK